MKRALRIGIDAHYVGVAAGGVETYTVNLIQELAALDARNAYTVYLADHPGITLALEGRRNFSTHRLWTNRPWIRLPITLQAALLRRPVDILHVHYAAPPLCPVPFVATIYDLSFERCPELFPRLHPHRATRIVASTARRAAKVITVSENSKADLLDLYRLPAEKVAVIPLGISGRFRPAEDPQVPLLVVDRYGIRRPFILYVGYLQASKNVAGLIRAYSALKQRTALPHQLVIVGREHYLFQEIYRAREHSPVREQISFVGYVPDADLVAFYQAADLLVHPSFFEGFGLTPLEAMACGTPVIAAGTSSLPEVVGEAGILFDPHDLEELAEAMRRVLTEPDLRRAMRERGLPWARRFSWRRTAEATLAVYEEVGACTSAGV